MRSTMRALQAVLARAHTLDKPSSLIRPFGTPKTSSSLSLNDDFQLFPDFFTEPEAMRLIEMSLWKLNRADPTRRRRGRAPAAGSERQGKGLQGLFEENYGFEEGHFDAVINHYRETLLSSLPPSTDTEPLLSRLYDLLPNAPTTNDIPPPKTSTHLLHLAPHGQILPHIDNIDASGTVIIGLSLGAERILRLESEGCGWEILLKSGSVYRQKDAVRYKYKHSILDYVSSAWDRQPLEAGHRISLMVRDAPPSPQ